MAYPKKPKSLPTPGQIFAALRAAVAEPILLSRDTEAALWSQAATDPEARGVLADYLEERGDPMHHVLRGHSYRLRASRLVPIKVNHHGFNMFAGASFPDRDRLNSVVMSNGYHPWIKANLPPDVIKEIQEYHGAPVSPVTPESR